MNKQEILEKIYDTLSTTEVMLIMSTNCLLLTAHNKEFVDTQRELIKHLDIRQAVKDYCNMIFDEIIIKEAK